MGSHAVTVLQIDKGSTTLQIHGARAWWSLLELESRAIHAWLIPGSFRNSIPPAEGEILETEPLLVDPSGFQIVKEPREALEPLGPKGAFRISGRVAFCSPSGGAIVSALGLRFDLSESVLHKVEPSIADPVSFCVRLLCFREVEP